MGKCRRAIEPAHDVIALWMGKQNDQWTIGFRLADASVVEFDQRLDDCLAHLRRWRIHQRHLRNHELAPSDMLTGPAPAANVSCGASAAIVAVSRSIRNRSDSCPP